MSVAYDPTKDDIHLYNSSLYPKEKMQELGVKIFNLIHRPKGNAFLQLQQWKKIGTDVLKWLEMTG
jgi:hypothetical protein